MSVLPYPPGEPAFAPAVLPRQKQVRGPNHMKPQRDLEIVLREARAVLRINADGSVSEILNPDGRLTVIAVVNAAGQLAAELAFARQSPYTAQVDRTGTEHVSIQARRPTAVLSPDEVLRIAPLLAARMQIEVDAVVRTWKHVQLTHRVDSAWIHREHATPGQQMRSSEVVNGTLWKVAVRDVALLDAFRRQALAPDTRYARALVTTARSLVRILSANASPRSRHRAPKLRAFFRTTPNDRWLMDDDALLGVLRAYADVRSHGHAATALQHAQYLLTALREAQCIDEDRHEELWDAYSVPGATHVLGTLYVRNRPRAKQYRLERQVIFEILPSEEHWSRTADYDKVKHKRHAGASRVLAFHAV